jgi:hypothetical protein
VGGNHEQSDAPPGLVLFLGAVLAHATAGVFAQTTPPSAPTSLVARFNDMQKQIDEMNRILRLFLVSGGVVTLQRGYSFVVPEGNIVVGSDNVLPEGSINNIVAGSRLFVQGTGNIVAGSDNTVMGLYNLVVGKSIQTTGTSNVASGYTNNCTGSMNAMLGGQVCTRLICRCFLVCF